MADNGKPQQKKIKTEEFEPVFQSFLVSKRRKELDLSLLAVKAGLSDLTLGVLHVDSSNALDIVTFQESAVKTSVLSLEQETKIPKGAAVGDIFLYGIDVLQNYLDKEHTKIPEDILQRKALQKLLMFLTSKEDHGVLLEERDKEATWSVVLAQHLLSKLAVTNTYTIDSYMGFIFGDDLIGEEGDTSFGCVEGWHGKADIILEKESVPVAVFQIEDETDSTEEGTASCVEVKVTENFVKQMLAQTIVFSFLQRKLNIGKLKNYLIAGVGIASKYLILCFYDSENDVLLESKPVELFEGNSIRTLAVLFLWLALNYKLFCSGITNEMKALKSDFVKKLGDSLKIYTDDVTRPIYIPQATKEENDNLFPWANEPVTTELRTTPCIKYINLPPKSDDTEFMAG